MRSWVITVGWCLGLGSAAAQELPFELAFRRADWVAEEGPAVAPDGTQVAVAVIAPPSGTARSLSSRFQPGGTPSTAVGARLWWLGPDGQRHELGPPGATSFRPTWSPDGQRVAFLSDAGGELGLWVTSVTRGQPRRLGTTRVRARIYPGEEVSWSPDGATLYAALAPEEGPVAPAEPAVPTASGPRLFASGGEVAHLPASAPREARAAPDLLTAENLATIAAIDAKTGATRVLLAADSPLRPSLPRLSASGRWLAVLTVPAVGEDDLYRCDVLLVPAGGGAPVVLARGLEMPEREPFRSMLRWHPREDRLIYLQGGALWEVTFSTEEPNAPRRLAPAAAPLVSAPLLFSRDGAAAWVAEGPADPPEDGSEPRGRSLLHVPLDGSPPSRVALPAGEELLAVLRTDDCTAWEPDPGTVTLRTLEGATGRERWRRWRAPAPDLSEVPGDSGNLALASGGGRHSELVGRVEDAVTPPALAQVAPDLVTRQVVLHAEPRLAEIPVAAPVEFTSEVPDPQDVGVRPLRTVRTVVLPPPGVRPGQPPPAVVMIYGGFDLTRFARSFAGGSPSNFPALLWTSRGYAVVLPDLPLTPEGQPGNPLADLLAVLLPQLDAAAARGLIDGDRVALLGQSYGGYGVAGLLARSPRFGAGIAVSGLYDLPGIYGDIGERGDSFNVRWNERWQGRMGGPPWQDLPRYLANSPYYQADQIKTPLLLLHGERDENLTEARKLFGALRRLGGTAQLAIYPGEGHLVTKWSPEHAEDAAARVVAFLARHVKPAQ